MADQPFHYVPILKELSEAQHAVLAAGDWREGVAAPDVPADDRDRLELTCVEAALSRLRGAFQALDQRRQAMQTDVRLREHATMAREAPRIAQEMQAADASHLPPELRPDA